MHTVSQTGNGPVAIPYTCQEASAMQNRVVDSLLAELRSVIRELGQDGRLIDPSIYDTACCALRASSGTAIKIYLPRVHGVIDALPQPDVADATCRVEPSSYCWSRMSWGCAPWWRGCWAIS